MLAGEVDNRRSAFGLLQDSDDLRFRESALSHGVLQGRLYPVFPGTAGPTFWGLLTTADPPRRLDPRARIDSYAPPWMATLVPVQCLTAR